MQIFIVQSHVAWLLDMWALNAQSITNLRFLHALVDSDQNLYTHQSLSLISQVMRTSCEDKLFQLAMFKHYKYIFSLIVLDINSSHTINVISAHQCEFVV